MTTQTKQSQIQDFKKRIKEINHNLNENKKLIDKCQTILNDKKGNYPLGKSSIRLILNDCKKKRTEWVNESEDLGYFITVSERIQYYQRLKELTYKTFNEGLMDKTELGTCIKQLNSKIIRLEDKLESIIEGLSV